MLLTGQNILHYFWNNSIIEKSIISEGLQFFVEEYFSGSRNNTFIVKSNEKSFFVKQPKNFSAERIETIKNEANFYKLIQNTQDVKYLPKLIKFDAEASILIFENLSNYYSLSQEFSNLIFSTYGTSFSSTLAGLISKLHRQAKLITDSEINFKVIKPNLLRNNFCFYIKQLEDSNDTKLNAIGSALILVKDNLKTLANEWNDKGAIIHGDFRLGNLMYKLKEKEFDINDLDFKDDNLTLIDWEMASIGDHCWDLATFFSPYLACYFETDNKSICINLPSTTKFCLNLFLTTYYQASELCEKDSETFKLKVVKLAAINIIEEYINSIEENYESFYTYSHVQSAINEILVKPEQFFK